MYNEYTTKKENAIQNLTKLLHFDLVQVMFQAKVREAIGNNIWWFELFTATCTLYIEFFMFLTLLNVKYSNIKMTTMKYES